LCRFARHGDEAAFEELLRRHGAMVLHTGLRLLQHRQDAEDVFQATFLLLARKAGSIRRQASVGGWLHGVASRLALRARLAARRRHAHESQSPGRPAADPPADISLREAQGVLDEELARLADHLRVPLVLCYLEGATRDEAARQLGWSLATLKRRLERGRNLLRQRLTRRGVTLSAALLAAVAAEAAPAALVRDTLEAVRGAAVSANVAFLVRTAAASAAWRRATAALVLTLSLIAAGVGLAAHRAGEKFNHPMTGSEDPPSIKAANRPGPDVKPQAHADRYGDPLPPDAIARLGTVRFRCWADRIAFLPGDKVLAAVGQGAVSFWDVATGKETRRSVDMPWGQAFALSADGKRLAVAAMPNHNTVDIHLWEVDTGKRLRTFKGHQGRLHALATAVDGRTLVSAGGGHVWVWDTATGKEVWRAPVGPADLAVAISPDGKTLASAGWDVASAVSIREMATGKELHRFRLPLGVGQVAFAPDGKTLAAVEDWNDDGGIRENKVHLWDVATGQLRRQLTLREHILGIAFSPDSKSLATGHLDTFHIWDLATGKWLERLEVYAGRTDHVAFSGDGKTLATSGEETIRLWDVATGKEVPPPGDGHQGSVQALAFLADGKTLVTAGRDHTLRHWQAATGQEVRRFPGMGSAVFAPSFAGVSKTLALPMGNEVRLCDPATGKELRPFRYPDHVRQVALTSDGKTMAIYAGGKDLTLRLVDTTTGKERLARRDAGFIQVMAFSPGGEVLALGPQDPVLRLVDPATGSEVHQLRLTENVTTLAFSPDGKTLAGGAGCGTLHFWEVATGKERAQWPDRDLRGGSQMAFSPDGRVLAIGDSDGALRLRLAATGKELKWLRGHRMGITCLAFALDGKTLASGSWDTTALVWNVASLLDRKGEQPCNLDNRRLEILWTDLAGDDAAKAYRAIQELAAAPGQAVPFLKARLHPVPTVEPKQFDSLLVDLDSDHFAVREKATAELEKLGEAAAPALGRALAGRLSAEASRRVRSLLEQLRRPVPGPERLRQFRALEVLEQVGGDEALQVLATLAQGAPNARLTREAKAALDRRR
jgi:RNA polymerase sigma factor (sigma-70 family)